MHEDEGGSVFGQLLAYFVTLEMRPSVGRPARSYIYQLVDDTECLPEDLLVMMEG